VSGSSTVAYRVGQLRARLEQATDLRPSHEVDALFTELVELCCTTPPNLAEEAMSGLGEHAPVLRRLCATGESELETHWAKRIVAAADPHAELALFPYLQNYRDLVRMELAAVTALGNPKPASVAILGSGPLPLTGIVLAAEYGVRVVHVDRDSESLQLGADVTAAIGLADTVTSELADLEDPLCLEALSAAGVDECDVIVLAALVGSDGPAKQAVSARIAGLIRPSALVLARSAVRMRSLLYPEVRAADLVGLDVGLEMHPYNDVVNSVLVARPRGAAP
jgi:hypothetical protein